MAELSFKVRAEYEKVTKLREEIAKLEAQMKSFGRNTSDSEVKKVEAQLAAMTRQYEEMTKKIAEAEAEYDAMAKKMADKAKDIAAAQDKIVQQAAKSTASQSAVLTPVIDQSIEAQAKAYDELKAEIDAIAGSKANLVNQMLSEQNAIRLINAEIKQLNNIQQENGGLTAAQKERLNQLNGSLLNHKEALSEVRQSLTNYVKLENAASGSMNEISQSLSRMRMVYRDLSESERESPFGKELLASIHQADEKIKELDATIGNHQRNVGNYGQQWNGLNMSIQQLGRELPALAYGPKVFFSAISNNLPILADEIKRARSEYDAMVAAGEKGTPVWKQIGSSILSWQMALTVGITLLTMYGDKIIDWGQKLIQGSRDVTSVEKATKKLNKAMAEGAKEAASEVVQLKVLEKIATDSARSDDERDKAARKVLDTLHESVNATNIMKVKNGEYAASIDDVTASLIKQAQAQAAMEKIQEQYKKVIDAQSKLAKKEAKGVTWWDRIMSPVGAETGEEGYEDRIENLKGKVEKAQVEFNVWLESFVSGFNFDSIFGETSNADLHNYLAESLAEIEQITKMQADYAKEKAKSAQDMEYAVEQARIDAMKDGYIKTRAQRLLNNKKELEDIERQKQDYIDRVVEQEKAIFDAQEEQRAKNDEKYKKQTFNRSEAEAKVDTASYDRLAEQTRQRQVAAEDEYIEGLYNQYQSYQDKKKELEKSYLDDVLALNTEYILSGDEKYLRSLEERRKAYVKTLNALEQETDDSYKIIFRDPSKTSQDGLNTALDLAVKKLHQLIEAGADADVLSPLYEQIKAIREELDDYEISGIVTDMMSLVKQATDLEKARKRLELLDKGSDLYKRESEAVKRGEETLKKSLIATGVMEFSGLMTQAASAMHQIAKESKDVELEELAKALDTTGGIINSSVQGMLQAGPWGLLVGLITSTVGAVANLAIEAEAADARMANSLAAFRREIELTQLQIDSANFGSIFGMQQFEMASDALKKAREAVALFKAESEKLTSLTWKYGTGINWIPEEGVLFETYDKIEGLKNKDIWDESGLLDIEKARAFLATSETITDEAREQVEYAIRLREAYDEAQKVLDDFLSSFVGSTASDITDAIFEGIDNGSDAWDIFEDKGAETIRSLGKQMLKELIQKSLAETWSEKLRAAAGNPEDLADTYASMMEWIKSQMSAYQDAAAAWEEQYGHMYQAAETEQQASSRGYQTLSEDTGNELVGRALAQYESNLRMEESMRAAKESVDLMAMNQVQIRDIAAESRALIADAYLELQQIRENTGAIIKPIKEINQKLTEANQKLDRL